ncbi:MAG: thioesterase family protein [Chlorobi bacterium]|nr:thioesterase family protein [Chlorobiota bacterium]
MIRRDTTIRVRYRDTDQMGVVYHGVYLEFFETGRTELLRQLGFPYASLEESGVMLPLIDAYIKMLRPARYDNLLTVTATVVRPITARMRIDYEIHYAGALLVSGYTVHAFTTVDGMRPVRPPKSFLEMLDREEGNETA